MRCAIGHAGAHVPSPKLHISQRNFSLPGEISQQLFPAHSFGG